MTARASAFRPPTTAQTVGSDPGVSSWVTASAGTGKTRVLTDRILRLLLAGAAPSKILALTFTKAAAAEMKSRVVESLVRWATAPREELAAELQVLRGSGVAFSDEELATARRQLPRVLDEPGGIPIQTIHSFCQSLLGRFPVESGIAAHFQVMDERTAAEMQFDARDALLGRTAADPDLAREIAFVTERANEGQFGDLMHALAGDRSRLGALLADGADAAADRLRARLGLDSADTPEAIVAAACADGAFDADALRRAADAMVAGGKSESRHGAAILDWLESLPERRQAQFGEYLAAFFKDRGVGGAFKESTMLTKATRAAMPQAQGILNAETERLEAARQRFRAAATWSQTAALLRVAEALLAEIERNKRRHARVDYDDLILKTAELLRRPGIGEWVRFKLDGGIDHFLIDEAQDTSPVQWDVIDLLTAEFFAGEGARDETRTVFAVGDPKQSIYGFRHADPALFARWRERFQARVEAAEEVWRAEELVESFRTVPVILNVVDKVFEAPEARKGLLFDGSEIHHISRRAGQGGFLELWPVEAPGNAATPSAWEPARQNEQRDSPSARLAQRIADCIRGWVGVEPLPARNRAVRAGDVMVLVQRRTAFVAELIRELKLRGIPVAGVDRMVLTDQLPVADLLALARFALFPDDDLNLAVVLKGPFVGLSEEALFELAHNRDGRLWSALSARRDISPDFAAAHDALAAHLARADTVPPHTFFAELLAAGGRRRLFARLGREADDPVDEFLASALEYEQTHAPSLQGFLRWIESGRTEVKREQEQARDEVRVLTVHGAKGLQAPIVFLADTVRVPGHSEPMLWDSDDSGGVASLLWPRRTAEHDPVSRRARDAARQRADEEYRRSLYVAMTRAEDRLVVCGWKTKNEQSNVKSWFARVSDAAEALGDVPEERGDGVRRWSSPQTNPEPESRAPPEPAPLPPLPAWADAHAPAPAASDAVLSPSAPAGADPPVWSPKASGRAMGIRRGVLIHRMLQLLPELAPGARAAAAARFAAANGDGFTAADRDEMAAATLAVLTAPSHAALFGPGSLAEVPVTGRIGATVVSGQIDRLLVTAHEVLIVDYKTHRPAPADESAVPPAYFRQMAAYRGILERIYPGRPVRCALLWTDGPRWMNLSESALDRGVP